MQQWNKAFLPCLHPAPFPFSLGSKPAVHRVILETVTSQTFTLRGKRIDVKITGGLLEDLHFMLTRLRQWLLCVFTKKNLSFLEWSYLYHVHLAHSLRHQAFPVPSNVACHKGQGKINKEHVTYEQNRLWPEGFSNNFHGTCTAELAKSIVFSSKR